MITFSTIASPETPANHSVLLTFHQRVKRRQRIQTTAGVDAGIVQSSGAVLHNGDKLLAGEGQVLEIIAEPEPVSVATADSAHLFARACYHVGNRHAEVQIKNGQLIYLRDHVLDDMLMLLGLNVTNTSLAFSPENGAYAHGHGHGRGHGHSHSHGADERHHEY